MKHNEMLENPPRSAWNARLAEMLAPVVVNDIAPSGYLGDFLYSEYFFRFF